MYILVTISNIYFGLQVECRLIPINILTEDEINKFKQLVDFNPIEENNLKKETEIRKKYGNDLSKINTEIGELYDVFQEFHREKYNAIGELISLLHYDMNNPPQDKFYKILHLKVSEIEEQEAHKSLNKNYVGNLQGNDGWPIEKRIDYLNNLRKIIQNRKFFETFYPEGHICSTQTYKLSGNGVEPSDNNVDVFSYTLKFNDYIKNNEVIFSIHINQ